MAITPVLPILSKTDISARYHNRTSIISIRWGGVAGNGLIESSPALGCGRQQKADESTTKQE
jgi:hypothetical protein